MASFESAISKCDISGKRATMKEWSMEDAKNSILSKSDDIDDDNDDDDDDNAVELMHYELAELIY